MRLHVGTSGFAYREWVGSFYPEGTREKAMLAYYGERLTALEINNTFYRFPTVAGLAAWTAKVDQDFQFAIKVPQRITHQKRLRDVDEEITRLVETVTTLGPHLGPLLFLLPPRMPVDLSALNDLLFRFPPQLRVAFEFRNPAWLCDAVFALLAQHRCVACFNDAIMATPRPTADWGYVRLRRETYAAAEIESSARLVLGQPWREAWVFVKHEAPDSPLLAQQWLATATRLLGK